MAVVIKKNFGEEFILIDNFYSQTVQHKNVENCAPRHSWLLNTAKIWLMAITLISTFFKKYFVVLFSFAKNHVYCKNSSNI